MRKSMSPGGRPCAPRSRPVSDMPSAERDTIWTVRPPQMPPTRVHHYQFAIRPAIPWCPGRRHGSAVGGTFVDGARTDRIMHDPRAHKARSTLGHRTPPSNPSLPTQGHAMSQDEITIRPIDYARDAASLKSFLVERDQMRLDHCEPAVKDGDCFVFVADEGNGALGWVVVHTKFREDQDWSPPDEDTRAFQSGEDAYVENIEVTARARSNGMGRRLLAAAQDE